LADSLISFPDGLAIVALAGGVGGAKLADGLAQLLNPDQLTIVVNTGDDFEHLGLYICPDLDTVCYTLAGIANPDTGWGRTDETWHALESMERLEGITWFRLGDRDLGLHIERTRRFHTGESLSQITGSFCQSLGVAPRILPATDNRVPTIVKTLHGEMTFQEYFVHCKCQPQVTGFRFERAEKAVPAPGVLGAIYSADLVILCPSNPWVSIDPILAIPGVREAVANRPVVAVSPIIGGSTVRGPAAKIFTELGIQPSALAVARHYRELLTGFVLDCVDEGQVNSIRELGIQPLVTDTWMRTLRNRFRLAQEVIEFGARL
jgi:LPPG:FO 2-phospho-L-lactate transferase